MSTIRHNALTGEDVIVAPERRGRPNAFVVAPEQSTAADDCPFCPEREWMTPPEILRIEEEGGWELRLFPNKYPVALPGTEGGGHEVLVEARGHDDAPEVYDEARLRRIFRVYRSRYGALTALSGARCVSIFKNCGQLAGASIRHPHTQFLALTEVPRRLESMARAFGEAGCPLCAELESAFAARQVAETEHFVLVAPWASRFAYELQIVPRRHASSILEHGDAQIDEIASLLDTALRALRSRVGRFAFNWSLQQAPLDGHGAPAPFHWLLEIVPRLTFLAGFELATGAWINSIPPEAAAAELREAVSAGEGSLA